MSTAAIAEAEKILYRAGDQLEKGFISEAVDLLSELISIYPEFGKAYCMLGAVYLQKFNDFQNAEINIQKAVDLAPDFAPALLLKAELLIQVEKYTQATATLNKAAEISGVKKDRVNYLFGLLNELQAKFDDAIGFYKKAISYTLSDDSIVLFEKAINRCLVKKKYS